MTQMFRGDIRQLAYDQIEGSGPGIVFLSGFNSTKDGTKALFLEDWASRAGRAYLRFDYSGHGLSSGLFEEGSIGDWVEDAATIIQSVTEGRQILVGSSMGGWIALLLARQMPRRIAGLVTIAAAPDFTEEKYNTTLSDEQRSLLIRDGQVEIPSDYDDGPYTITQRLIDEGRNHLIFKAPLTLPFPTRFLQGTEDTAVSTETATRLLHHAKGLDMRLTLVKGADHRFSTPDCLEHIMQAIEDVSERSSALTSLQAHSPSN